MNKKRLFIVIIWFYLALSYADKPASVVLNKKRCRTFDIFCFSRKEGDSNPRYPNRVRQFSKLVVSATHPSFLTDLR